MTNQAPPATRAECAVAVALEDMRRHGIPTDRRPDAVPLMVGAVPLHVRPWTATERVAVWRWVGEIGGGDQRRFLARLFKSSVCNARGELMFENAPDDEVIAFGPTALLAVADAVLPLNGIIR